MFRIHFTTKHSLSVPQNFFNIRHLLLNLTAFTVILTILSDFEFFGSKLWSKVVEYFHAVNYHIALGFHENMFLLHLTISASRLKFLSLFFSFRDILGSELIPHVLQISLLSVCSKFYYLWWTRSNSLWIAEADNVFCPEMGRYFKVQTCDVC